MTMNRSPLFFLALTLSFSTTMTAGSVLPEAARSPVPPPPLEANAWLLIDHETGTILAEHNVDERVEPASLTKMMTTFVVLERIRDGALRIEDDALVSDKAWKTGGSKMFIEVNKRVSIEDLLKGVIIQSGNDASIALAEHVAGSETGFATMMNEAAHRLGMTNSHFTNSTGLPDEEQYSTAKDLTLLSSALIREFPDHYSWHAIKEFTYSGIKQLNRNLLLWRDRTVDGIKTGYTQAAGYCLIASAKRGEMRLIATVLGAGSIRERTSQVQSLLAFGYAAYELPELFAAEEVIEHAELFFAEQETVAVGFAEGLTLLVPKGQTSKLTKQLTLGAPLKAPLVRGAPVGTMTLSLKGEELGKYPVVALSNIKSGGWWDWIVDTIRLWFY